VNIQSKSAAPSGAIRGTRIEGSRLADELNEQGFAVLEKLLSREECRSIASFYPDDNHFRSRVVMDRHGFGKGEYKYFGYPLPGIIGDLRTALYSRLVPIANAWNERMRLDLRYPVEHAEFLKLCHAAGQLRPTPLLLRYERGDYNCLHQDLTANWPFRSKSRSCCPSQARTSLAASLCSTSNGRACSRARRWSRWSKATRWPSLFTTDP
jgi:hypothetical protein